METLETWSFREEINIIGCEGVDWINLDQSPAAASCEHGFAYSGSRKAAKYRGHLHDCKPLNKGCAPRSFSLTSPLHKSNV